MILRPYREEDLQDLYEYLSDEEVVKYEPYLPMNIEEAAEELRSRMADPAMIAVERKSDKKLIGNLYLDKREFDSLELGYAQGNPIWKDTFVYARLAK